jgi:hypothetical protein
MVLLVGALFSGEAVGANKEGQFTVYGGHSCEEYLDAYANATLTGTNGFNGKHNWWQIDGWIDGYLTAYNQLKKNLQRDVIVKMSPNASRRWMASWCRDNPSDTFLNAIFRLIRSQPFSIPRPGR